MALVVATVGWGLNIGVTTNLARGIVQESAESEFTGRVMAVFGMGMVAAPDWRNFAGVGD